MRQGGDRAARDAKMHDARDGKATAAQIDAQVKALNTPWFHYFFSYAPAVDLRRVTCPVLVLNGEKDLQVPPKQNLAEIEKALKAGGNGDATVKEMPGLNHLFQTSKPGSPSEYGTI